MVWLLNYFGFICDNILALRNLVSPPETIIWLQLLELQLAFLTPRHVFRTLFSLDGSQLLECGGYQAHDFTCVLDGSDAQ